MPRTTTTSALGLLCLVLAACQPSREEQQQFLRDYYVEHRAEIEPRKVLMDQYWARAQELRLVDLEQPLVLGDRPTIETEYPKNAVLAYDGLYWSSDVVDGELDTAVHRLERGMIIYERKNLDKLLIEAEFRVEEHLSTRYLAAVKEVDRLDASTTDDLEMEEGKITGVGYVGGFARAAVLVFDLDEEAYLGCKQIDVQIKPGTTVRGVDLEGSFAQELSKTIAERAKATVEFHKDPSPEPEPGAGAEPTPEVEVGE